MGSNIKGFFGVVSILMLLSWFDATTQKISFADWSGGDINGLTGIYNSSSITQTCICVPIGRCNSTQNTLDGSGMLDVRIVTSTGTTNTSENMTPYIVTPVNCVTGLERCCWIGGYQCGLQFPSVASAKQPAAGQAPYGKYPWQAVLLGPGDVYVGSGALIDPLNVITAAHKINDYVSSNRLLKIRMGEWDASTPSELIPVQEYNVMKFFIHPSYSSSNLRNDIAVLRLSSAVNLGITPTITNACLTSTSFVGSRCWISGWGKNDFFNGVYQAIQKEVDVVIRSQIDCEVALKTTRLGTAFQLDSTSFICAGGESGRDACTGDGGSPLVCPLGGQFFVVGLVAWGIGCGTSNIPGVYVNVAAYLPWITNVTRSS
ncbi:phenoloxidase-activating factor 2-like isoform X2 [Sabethes cyaneus]|uniref:phenoloxidase-activating factor 2-like isoform X2 n=1 Tax=Sabethes cyaneus TaxID=53552 RepID=UPI00237DE94D|nr:phenoloxidase-activating factor 2-like isoform X2 [Sabethes cyaneus]